MNKEQRQWTEKLINVSGSYATPANDQGQESKESSESMLWSLAGLLAPPLLLGYCLESLVC